MSETSPAQPDPAQSGSAQSGPARSGASWSASGHPEIEWDVLRAAAVDALTHAYVPYSRFPVGVAALVDDGRIISGCNVENASYGLTLCAECGLVSNLHLTGGGRLVAFTCVDGNGDRLMPCGRCRQLLYEHSAEGMLLETVSGIRTIDEVLPDAFGPRTLAAYNGE